MTAGEGGTRGFLSTCFYGLGLLTIGLLTPWVKLVLCYFYWLVCFLSSSAASYFFSGSVSFLWVCFLSVTGLLLLVAKEGLDPVAVVGFALIFLGSWASRLQH